MSQSFTFDSTKKSVASHDVMSNHRLPGQRPFVVQPSPQITAPSTANQRERMARLDAGVGRAGGPGRSPHEPVELAQGVGASSGTSRWGIQRKRLTPKEAATQGETRRKAQGVMPNRGVTTYDWVYTGDVKQMEQLWKTLSKDHWRDARTTGASLTGGGPGRPPSWDLRYRNGSVQGSGSSYIYHIGHLTNERAMAEWLTGWRSAQLLKDTVVAFEANVTAAYRLRVSALRAAMASVKDEGKSPEKGYYNASKGPVKSEVQTIKEEIARGKKHSDILAVQDRKYGANNWELAAVKERSRQRRAQRERARQAAARRRRRLRGISRREERETVMEGREWMALGETGGGRGKRTRRPFHRYGDRPRN